MLAIENMILQAIENKSATGHSDGKTGSAEKPKVSVEVEEETNERVDVNESEQGQVNDEVDADSFFLTQVTFTLYFDRHVIYLFFKKIFTIILARVILTVVFNVVFKSANFVIKMESKTVSFLFIYLFIHSFLCAV